MYILVIVLLLSMGENPKQYGSWHVKIRKREGQQHQHGFVELFCSMLNSIHGLVMFDMNLVYRLGPVMSRPCQSFKSKCLFIMSWLRIKIQEPRLIRNCGCQHP